MIAHADRLCHGIPGEREVEHAVARFLGSDLIEVRERRLFLTRAGQEVFDRFQARLEQAGPQPFYLRTTIALEELARSHPGVAAPAEWHLQPGELHTAYEVYHAWFQDLTRPYLNSSGLLHPPGDE
jgi:hypothetical protein